MKALNSYEIAKILAIGIFTASSMSACGTYGVPEAPVSDNSPRTAEQIAEYGAIETYQETVSAQEESLSGDGKEEVYSKYNPK